MMLQLLAWAAAVAARAPDAPGWSPNFTSPFTSSVFSYDTLESTMFAWQGKHYVMEGINCKFWQNDSAVVAGATMDPAFANHSYFRIREVGSGLVVINIPYSQGFGFPNAHVDYEHMVVWIFASPGDRCGHQIHSGAYLQSWRSAAADLGDLGSWTTAVAGGTEGYAVPNVDVGRVIMEQDEFTARGLPPHKAIMIGEYATFHINNEPDGNLTKGWVKTGYVVQDHTEHVLGCPSVRFGTDGYYYVVSGMGGTWNGITRSRDLVSWTYGRGTCIAGHPDGQPGCTYNACCGAVNRPGYEDMTLGPYNAWLNANLPADFKLNADPLNLPIWNSDNNDPDVCCQGPNGTEEPVAYIIYGSSAQGRRFVNASVRPPGKTLGTQTNNIGVFNGTLTQFLSSYFD